MVIWKCFGSKLNIVLLVGSFPKAGIYHINKTRTHILGVSLLSDKAFELELIVVIMARPSSMIGDIKTLKQTLRLAFRTRLWYADNPPYPPAIEMVFMDAKGDKIHATVRDKNLLYAKWKPISKEGHFYEMQNFSVQRADGHFRSGPHPFKLNFSTGTIAKEIDLPEVPPNIYHFTSFDEILSGKACTDVLVDVIGQFIEKGQYHAAAARKKIVISLKDRSGKVLGCTLWEGYASKMVSFIENHGGGPIVIILTLAKIHEAIDNYSITISNSKWGSTLLINENVKEIEEYKSSLDPSDVYQSGSEIMSQISGSSQFSSDDAFFYKAEVKSLFEICSLTQETQCCTVAKIENVLAENGWSYDHCIRCNKKAQTCGCREGNPSVVPRFKVEVMVSDKDDSAKFVLWDNECVELLNKKAVELRNQMIADGELNPMAIPQAFDNLEGKTLAFKIKVQPRYRSSSVVGVSQKQHIIEEVLQKLTVEKEPCTIDKGKSVCSVEKDDYQCETIMILNKLL